MRIYPYSILYRAMSKFAPNETESLLYNSSYV